MSEVNKSLVIIRNSIWPRKGEPVLLADKKVEGNKFARNSGGHNAEEKFFKCGPGSSQWNRGEQ